MDINTINKNNIEKMTDKFDNMVREGTLSISKIENLLTSNIDEKQLIIKKNKNGKKKATN